MNENDLRSILALAALKQLGAPDANGEIAAGEAGTGSTNELVALVDCLRALEPKRGRHDAAPVRRRGAPR